jgi:putative peptide zinc metalloprotease protein
VTRVNHSPQRDQAGALGASGGSGLGTTDPAERPALAPTVRLIGELQDSGFVDRQWLVQRDGQFIQVTELLYRLLERIDGRRTLQDIAADVTQVIPRIISADQVGYLVRTRLLPLGLIAPPPGVAGASGQRTRGQQGPSPLRVNLRMKMVGPRVIDPITRVLQVLYRPGLLVPLLVAAVVAHGWLYLGHGVSAAIYQALYTPGLLLAVLAIMLLGGIVHEFGHAAALRRGGGKVRAMGAGFYFAYPAFYTDTTDSYRLGRWARVRTDLGGFYFHLLFALAIIGFYTLTQQEFLLLVVVLVNAEILRQLLPLGRLDGYWVLADLTGIPDLFSQMGPYLRSVLPSSAQRQHKLPRLKPWVTVIFAVYIAVTVPLLVLFFLFLVTRLPTAVAIVRRAAVIQVQAFSLAEYRGDLVGMAASVAQLLIFGLELVGIGVLLYVFAARLLRAAWRRPPARPRNWAAAATVALLLLGFLIVPALPSLSARAPAGTQRLEVPSRLHVVGPVRYAQIPPVGGEHAPVWQNCGFYPTPVPSEQAVHSLEHGAVWITYRPSLPKRQIDLLRRYADHNKHLLVSPFSGLPAPVVVSAWGYQLHATSADDRHVLQFIRAFEFSGQAPERGNPCTGGAGTPR